MTSTLSAEKLLTILVVDDHESVLDGTILALKQQYPEAQILKAQTTKDAIAKIHSFTPNLAIVDLSLPEQASDLPKSDTGIGMLRTILENYPTLNVVVQSANTKALVRLRPQIYEHEAGFTVADKGSSLKDMLTKVEWATQGLIYTPKEMRSGLELKEEWLTLLEYAFVEGLQDKEIAKRMNVAERTVRHYWSKIQDALKVYPEMGKNIRIQTEIIARREGLID
ncbi:MAG: response regulator transcription factor [Cyanobacteria bacterium P01_G01_bin.19]